MIRRLVLTSAVVLGSIVTFASNANAGPVNQDVLFNGSIISSCEFTSKADGTVTPNLLIGATSLGSTAAFTTGAASGQVKVKCNGGGSVTAATPQVELSPAGATFAVKTSLLDSVVGTIPNLVLANIEKTITVDMTATSTNPLSVGNYKFNVVITAAPN